MEFQQPQNGMYDPSSFIDPSAIANPQMNGTRPYPMSSIPQKRDSTGAALSRSQTPSQQPQFGFPQQGFAHTPSPTMQNQHFRPGQVVPQRMQSPAQNPHAPQMSPMGFNQGAPMQQPFDPSGAGQYQGVQLSQHLQSRQQEAQRRYQMQMQQQQQQMNNLASSNFAAQQRHQAGQMQGMPMQYAGARPGMMQGQIQNVPDQSQAFVKNVAAFMAQNNRPFNMQPMAAGRVINLQHLYYVVMKLRGWKSVNQNGQWAKVAQTMGFDLRQFPNAPEELRIAYGQNLVLYEQYALQSQQRQRMNQMQPHMAGVPPQMSPTRPSIPGAPNNTTVNPEYLQQLQKSRLAAAQQQQLNPALQQTPQQPTFDAAMQQQQQLGQMMPLQNNVALEGVNGRSTPQTEGKPPSSALEQHRKSLSRQLESTPDQPSPVAGVHSAPPIPDKAKEETAVEKINLPTDMVEGKVTYRPSWRVIDRWSGLDFDAENFKKRVDELVYYRPNVPSLPEMGVIDIRALTMSIRSGLHAETRLALDMLAKLSHEQQLTLELEKCEDLVEVLVDYGEDLLDTLANDNPEVSDIVDLTPYEDVLHNCNAEVYSLQDPPAFGSKAYELDRTADRLLAITTIFRNLSFLEINHAALSTPQVLKFFSNAIRLVGTRVLLLRTHVNTFDFMKDLVTFFSNTSTKISLPSREDAYIILHFLCAFAPIPRPTVPVKFTPYNPRIHRCLPSAVDSLAKLLARDDPNRTYYKQIFINESTSSPPYDLLTRAFGLAIAVVPDRTSGILHQVHETAPTTVRQYEARIAELRKPYLMQGMLAADILASLAPGPETGVCRSWLESEDGWAVSLLKFAMSLCATDAMYGPQQQVQAQAQAQGRGQRPMDHDVQGFQLIVHRALSMIKRLGEKSKGMYGGVLVKGGPATSSSSSVGGAVNGHKQREGGKSGDRNGAMSADGEDGEKGEERSDDEDEDEDMETLSVGGNVWRVKADVLPKKETLLSALLMKSLDARSLRQFCGIGYLDDAT
ncbi:uncharacterized protein EI97DRAFT_431759 [Westerdykella ornata]|uniref:ARID domain-containing protein n=1 Tax=Westerdykella ornata TaxID=318751 RepID=A0A6A6JPS7_WESOR|nr:uncharacterized protein EI97DRAFT_431759 [Westerdykella ornata]KAF2278532.1 hypothetical protein EI97DRAFT_431759 [Westerdykella ornata]